MIDEPTPSDDTRDFGSRVDDPALDPGSSGGPPAMADRVGIRLRERAIAARLFGTTPEAEPIRVARFDVLRKLGEGGMGVVYAAYDASLDREIAIKLIRARHGDVRRTEARLASEARAMARLAHANVATVFEVGEHEGQVFIAMELVRGETLREWLATPRPWQDVFGVLLRAGRGLAAAHGAGLVHRDFKPDNVMVGPMERGAVSDVKVMDFGLAHDAARWSTHASADADAHVSSSTTAHPRWAGTPAYMAPEQLDGAPVDARADQFSFCATAYEAFVGRRPFLGVDLAALRESMARPIVPPSSVEVPRRVLLALMRGLAEDPAQRFPDMTALLHALQHDRWARARRLASGGAIMALVGAIGFGAARWDRQPPCAAPLGRTEALWGDARREAIDRAFLATEVPHAARAWESTAAIVDDYVEGWAAAKQDACRATRVAHTQSEDALELRDACLERRFVELDRLLAVLELPDPEIVGRAPLAAAALRPVTSCADAVVLRERRDTAATADAGAIAQVTDVLDGAEALLALGQPARAQSELVGLVPVAESIGDATILARTLLVAGSTAIELGDESGAIAVLERAVVESVAAGDAEFLAAAATSLAAAMGEGGDDYDRALAVLDLAEGALRRGGDPETLRQAWHAGRGNIFQTVGRYDDAHADFAAAARIASDARPPQPHLVGRARARLAYLQVLRGSPHEGIGQFTEVVGTCEAELGPTHPECAGLRRLLSSIYLTKMQWADAEREATTAISRLESVLGPEHIQLVPALRNLGAVYHRTGRYPEAESSYLRAREILRAHRGDGSAHESTLADELAQLYQQLGRLEEAEEAASAAVEITRRRRGRDSVELAQHLYSLATIVRERGDRGRARDLVEESGAVLDRLDLPQHTLRGKGLVLLGGLALEEESRREALDWFSKAAAHYEATEGPSGNGLAVALFRVGEAHEALGERHEAIAAYRRVLAILDVRNGANPMIDGVARFAFAKARWSDDRDEAVAQAKRAHASLAPIAKARADEVAAWLRAKGSDAGVTPRETAASRGSP